MNLEAKLVFPLTTSAAVLAKATKGIKTLNLRK